ncbi:uncharacterized protein wu:fk95d07 [Danio rerio]|uniref:Uncharacterized protein wu:fk95d07 n=2 Tax=Danio rerio TaxID=7955 RepID=A0AC58GLH3_DANRE|nr:uncharacterized protein wu:fk95d07 [Danio rerio]|eukprot:XP_002663543.1 uncharacterized protein wu:fk95d07 [Danio rerio]
MKTVIVVLSILGLCLGAPVEHDMDRDNEQEIDEGQQFAGSPLDQTDPITRTILYPVPRADGFLGNLFMNPFLNPYGSHLYYPQYPLYSGYPTYPHYPAYSLPPVIIHLPQRNP